MLKEYKDIPMDIDKSDSLSHNNDGLSLFCPKEGLRMPTERFYRLSKEKADKIRNAAIEEFKRVPPEEVSINKIIQNADISRGSFYTYFEDKDDLAKWILGDFIGHYRQFYVTGLKENGGDLWDVFNRVLDHTVRWVAEQSLVEIVGNMMRSSHFAESLVPGAQEGARLEEEHNSYMKMIYDAVDPKSMNLELEDFKELMGMHLAALIMTLKAYFGDNADLNDLKVSYQRRMRLLRYGACMTENAVKQK